MLSGRPVIATKGNRVFCKLYLIMTVGILSLALPAAAEPVQPQMSGLALESDREYEQAARQYAAEVAAAEELYGPYDIALFEPLMGLARSQYQLREYDAAIESIQRAQHVSHRHEGVHNLRQLAGTEMMTRIHLAQDKALLADKQQRFAFYVVTHDSAEDDLENLPALEKLADWYTKTGQLHRARKLNEQSIEIIEANFGEDSTQQLPYLQQLAKLKRLQRVCCSTRIMEQALSLVNSNPDLPAELKASIYIEVADAYTAAGDESEAKAYYQRAWSLMNDDLRRENFAEPHRIVFSQPLNERNRIDTKVFRVNKDAFGRRDLQLMNDDELRLMGSLPPQEFMVIEDDSDYNIRIRDRTINQDFEQEEAMRTVGSPFTFLHKQLLHILPNRYVKDENLSQVSISLQFDIDERGHANNIRILSENTPGKLARMMREVVRKSRFRPRMEDGILVSTENYQLTQTFQI